MNASTTKNEAVRFLELISIAVVLSFVIPAPNIKAAENRLVKALPGRWTVVQPIQDHLDKMSPTPHAQGGVVEKFEIKVMSAEDFWEIRQVREIERAIKQLLSEDEHEVVAAGIFGGSVVDKPLAWMAGFFLLTQKEGESFLCVLKIDVANYSVWRIHHVPGKTRDKDLLLAEIGDAVNDRQIAAFKYAGKLEQKSDSDDE